LLFLFTDEQRADTIGAYGNSAISMPNLDKLAGESMLFEKSYVSQPVCTPSRSTLMTGLWPHQNGCLENNVPLRPETKCISEMLEPGRYRTAYHGKWHLGDEIFSQHGFEEWRAIDDGYYPHYSEGRDKGERSGYHHFLLSHGIKPENGERFARREVSRLPEELSKPAYLAEEASRFIRENKDGPFALFVNFFEPHMPFTGPRDGQYPHEKVTLPENHDSPPGEEQPLKTRLFRQGYEQTKNLKREEAWRQLIARYWGLCSQVDAHAGRILDVVRQCGLWEDTIIVYTSDHGDMMGSHRLVAKCVMYEEAVRVPLIVRVPGMASGERYPHPVSQIDLVPSLLDLMGERIPADLPGKSLRGILEGEREPRGDVIVEWNGGNNGFGDRMGDVSLPDWMSALGSREEIVAAMRDPVRTVISPDGWKLNLSPLGEHELYNLNDDPGERRNLAGDAGSLEKMRELAAKISEWQGKVGDEVKLPNL